MLDVWTWGALITLVILFLWSLNHGDWAVDLGTLQEVISIALAAILWPVFWMAVVVLLVLPAPEDRR